MPTNHILLISTFVLTLVASANTHAATKYKVSAKTTHKKTIVAEPVVVVEEGTPADVTVPGPDGYQLSVTVTATDSQKANIVAEIITKFGKMAPEMDVRFGHVTTITDGDMELTLLLEPQPDD